MISEICSAAALYPGKIFRMEDVFITGILAEIANIHHIHHPGFNYRDKLNPLSCNDKFIIRHEVTPKEMIWISKNEVRPLK